MVHHCWSQAKRNSKKKKFNKQRMQDTGWRTCVTVAALVRWDRCRECQTTTTTVILQCRRVYYLWIRARIVLLPSDSSSVSQAGSSSLSMYDWIARPHVSCYSYTNPERSVVIKWDFPLLHVWLKPAGSHCLCYTGFKVIRWPSECSVFCVLF